MNCCSPLPAFSDALPKTKLCKPCWCTRRMSALSNRRSCPFAWRPVRGTGTSKGDVGRAETQAKGEGLLRAGLGDALVSRDEGCSCNSQKMLSSSGASGRLCRKLRSLRNPPQPDLAALPATATCLLAGWWDEKGLCVGRKTWGRKEAAVGLYLPGNLSGFGASS